ncbi:hypothetical protein MNBD_GAMMA06-228 [hydrothermal vent metagenome]|uniref:ABC transporter domain-containing protein n=1 Tax=hydrothermal vent metagenome TaxID=652676 RepID=A0A3B0WIR5_9ZZZZ
MSLTQSHVMNDSILLSLKEFGVAFGDRIILSSLTMEIPETGIVVVMGPSGTGKSTLLRSLAGLSAASPSYRTWGSLAFIGAPIEQADEAPVLVSQSAKLMMSSVLENVVSGLPERHTLTQLEQRELVKRLLCQAGLDALVEQLDQCVVELPLGMQRHLAILRAVASGPKLLCIDEPTTGVDDEDVARILQYIKNESEKRAVLIVLHNQRQAKKLGGQTVLLAGGWVQEMQPTDNFFAAPKSNPGKDFVRSGSCVVPSPDAKSEEINNQYKASVRALPKAATQFKSHVLGPRGFLWLKKGKLAGTPKPGLLKELEYDLEALKRVGVTHLVSLTEKEIDADICNEMGVEVIRSPMPDMQAPSNQQAVEICEQISALLESSKVIAVHCKAGLGRTGTVLAAQLIYEGANAINALEQTRGIEPRWIQSEVQVQFLTEFEYFLKTKGNIENGSDSPDVSGAANQ